ncbi:hypothetical protein W97_00155 [Coniosporium apollinis CBS 100218]|uniref:NADP-dependent oxidoreductase domain-containing protein n=1 Tax=Coniosporium apollinis (strain CBS 100218) TaxID=1168221 RepID=R7YGC2_CONA1|nr:uncharacterized protein W97_00155 [Coniosporium apollinis CBS 100218]EON60945.1 hypothetical protein W97_00155 [Coniosporium apollinis CBS 100218]
MAFAPAPEPKSLLGYHRILAPTAGARVSPLCLGAMNFGDAWKEFMGECNKETTFAMLDFFYENGGNFIDTANNYQGEESETWIGDWMKERNNREEMFIATKFTTMYLSGKGGEKIKSNFQGNHTKSLRVSLEASLKKLQTEYIDLLYLHWWDFTTSIEEVMQSLNQLVVNGKVLYLGISDTPAWIVSKCNQYARDHGLRQFSVYQGRWSAANRDFERDILPMARAEGMALAPWGALGGGKFKTEEQRNSGEGRNMGPASEKDIQISKALEKIANEKGTIITSVALAYVMHKTPYVFPIIGGRKVDHLKGNIEALGLELSEEEIDEIDNAAPFDVGFPLNFLFEFMGGKYNVKADASDIGLLKPAGPLDTVKNPSPIKPHHQKH